MMLCLRLNSTLLSTNSTKYCQIIQQQNIMIFIKRISKVNDTYFETDQIAIDSKLKHLALYDCNKDVIYLLTSIIVMHHMIEYKNKFEKDKTYKLDKSLPFHRKIANTKNQIVLKFLFAAAQNKQLFIVSYYNGAIAVYENKHNWQLVHSIQVESNLIDICYFQGLLYTHFYDHKIRAQSLVMLSHQTKPVIDECFNFVYKKGDLCLYEDYNGSLKTSNRTVIEGKKRKSEALAESQISKNILKTYKIDYLNRFIIKNHPCEIYSIQQDFRLVMKLKDQPDYVSISPFNYKSGIVMMLAYCNTLKLYKVLSPTVKGLKFKAEEAEALLQIRNLKYFVVSITWIGPYSLLVTDDKEKLWYLQIFSQTLQLA